MPARSTAQRRAMAIAEHHPEELHAANRGLLGMSHQQLHDFASTKEKGLPHYAGQHPHRNLGRYLHAPRGNGLSTHMRAMSARGAFRTVPRGTH
jgi:hypothetical protein